MRSLRVGLAAAAMVALAQWSRLRNPLGGKVERSEPPVRVDRIKGVKQKRNKTNNKINVFYGYASERKGKGQKKREAAQRRVQGWK